MVEDKGDEAFFSLAALINVNTQNDIKAKAAKRRITPIHGNSDIKTIDINKPTASRDRLIIQRAEEHIIMANVSNILNCTTRKGGCQWLI